jgi:hypothetical protein
VEPVHYLMGVRAPSDAAYSGQVPQPYLRRPSAETCGRICLLVRVDAAPASSLALLETSQAVASGRNGTASAALGPEPARIVSYQRRAFSSKTGSAALMPAFTFNPRLQRGRRRHEAALRACKCTLSHGPLRNKNSIRAPPALARRLQPGRRRNVAAIQACTHTHTHTRSHRPLAAQVDSQQPPLPAATPSLPSLSPRPSLSPQPQPPQPADSESNRAAAAAWMGVPMALSAATL